MTMEISKDAADAVELSIHILLIAVMLRCLEKSRLLVSNLCVKAEVSKNTPFITLHTYELLPKM